jgi:hypothetical protein
MLNPNPLNKQETDALGNLSEQTGANLGDVLAEYQALLEFEDFSRCFLYEHYIDKPEGVN